MGAVSGLLRGGAFRVFAVNSADSPEHFLRRIDVGTAFVISGDTATEVEIATKEFARVAKGLGMTLRWDESEVLRTRERVVLTGIAPNELTRILTKHRQHGLVRARQIRPEVVVDPETGIAEGPIETVPRERGQEVRR